MNHYQFCKRLALATGFYALFVTLHAQIPAAALFQTPLQIHPAMAGNTGLHRLALLANRNDYYVPAAREGGRFGEMNRIMSARTVYDNATNVYASYDQLWKGYGIGAFVTHSQLPVQTNSNSEFRKEYGTFSAGATGLGIVISPKWKIPHPVLPGEVKYTVAPSLMLGYKGGHELSKTSVPYENYFDFKQSVIEKEFSTRQLSLQTGLMINSKRGYLGYNMGLIWDFSSERQQYERDTLRLAAHISHTYLAMQHSACLGLLFPLKEKSDFTFSPVFTLGISHSLAGGKKSESLYLPHVQTGLNWFGYLHQSLNFRWKQLLFGAAYTEYENQRLAAYHVGLKLKHIRCTVFYSFWDKQTTKAEAAIHLTF